MGRQMSQSAPFKPRESEDLTDIGDQSNVSESRSQQLFQIRSSSESAPINFCRSIPNLFEATGCTSYSSSQNNNRYLGTGLSIALSKSLSRLDLCGLSPCCPSTLIMLIMDCAIECRSQRVSTVTSVWPIEVGAESFHFIFAILPSRILWLRVSNALQIIDDSERRG
jgi:hypothetical protein